MSAKLNSEPRSSAAALLLFALAVAGHAAGVALIDVRPYAMFQHFVPWSALPQWPIAAAVLLVQAVVVTALSWKHRARLAGVARRLPKVPAFIAISVVAGLALVVPTESVARTAGEFVLAAAVAIVAGLNLLLAAVSLPGETITRMRTWIEARVTLAPADSHVRAWDRALPRVMALWVTALAAFTAFFVFERVPHIDDSVSNVFQAKYFSTGQLWLPAPPDAASFQVDQTVIENGRWFGYAFPAWPATLAIGVLAGVPWLVNPVLAGLLMLLAHAWIRRRFDRGTANGTLLLLACSPWLIFMSGEFMVHPLTGVLVIGAAYAFDRALDREGAWPGWAATAGLAVGTLVLTRAIDAAIVVAAFGLAAALERRLSRAWTPAAIAGVVATCAALLILPYNEAVTGRADYPPHMAWSDSHWGPGVDRLGFGRDIGIRQWPNLDPLPGHGAADVVLNINKNAFMTNADLFGWSFGSLALLALGIGVRGWRRVDFMPAALVVTFIAGYSTYWFSGGPDLGPRYWYPLLVPFALLTVRAIQNATARIITKTHAVDGQSTAARFCAVIAAASISAALVVLPWRATTKYYRYRGISGEVRALAARHQFERALVFVRSGPDRRDYASAFVLNPRTLEDEGSIYALDAGPEHRAAVVKRFRDRPVWVIGRQPGDHSPRPFVVIAGPLRPGTVPE